MTIGGGLRGQPGWRATVYAWAPKTVAALARGPRGGLWIGAAGLTTHGRDGVYLVARSVRRPRRVISGGRDPLGLVWRRGELFVASLGRVDAFSGWDGVQFTRRRRIVDGPVRGAENNALAVAPGGRLVMGVSASCDHCRPRSPLSGAIVSFRPDGTDLRAYATGIRAPVGLAFVPGTSHLLATMNQRDDLASVTPGDSLSLVRRGSHWGFPECYGQGGRACRGVPRPLAVLDRHGAAGDVTVTRGDASRPSPSAIVAECQSAKVQRVALTPKRVGRPSHVAPFLLGLKNPIALASDRAGALLVADWGTGRVYRVAPRWAERRTVGVSPRG